MLNLELTDEAYLCGRLFAVLEQIQQSALGFEVNASIKDKFFASACSTPYLVFPCLRRLAENHLKKIEYQKKYNDTMNEIMDKFEAKFDGETLLSPFPRNFDMNQQGIFILGYHQQSSFYQQEIANAKEAKAKKKQTTEREEN